MKKLIAVVLVFLLVTLTSCASKVDLVGETKTYEIASEIHSLDIQIDAADVTIEYGDRCSVESNLNYLSVSEHNGILSIVEEDHKQIGMTDTDSTDAVLKLCVPNDSVFESVSITTGAAKVTADALSANSLKLKLGAGDVQLGCLNAYSKADIAGGTGQITVASGTLKDLSLKMGVGELNLTAALPGNSNLSFGVGKSHLTLIGSKDTYKIDIEKSIGDITVDGKTATDFVSNGDGQNDIKIEGGIGTVDIIFMQEQPGR